MILYEVTRGVINAKPVLRETKCGWRQHNNGFINRRVMKKYFSIDDCYYTTDLSEAKQWQKKMVMYLHHIIQVSSASLSDIEFWESNGMVEQDIPKSRIVLSSHIK